MSSAEDQNGKSPTEPLNQFPRLGELDKAIWPYIWEKLITERTRIQHLDKDVMVKFGIGEREARAAVRGEVVRAARIFQTYLLDGMATRLNEVMKLEELYQKAWSREDIKLCLDILDRVDKLRDVIREVKKKNKPQPALSGGKGKKGSGIDDEIRQQVLKEEMERIRAEQAKIAEAELKKSQEEASKKAEESKPDESEVPPEPVKEKGPDLDKMSPQELRALAATKGLAVTAPENKPPRNQPGLRSDEAGPKEFTLDEAMRMRIESNGG